MKFKIIYTLFITVLVASLFLGNSNGRADGNGQGNTGAPGDETLSNGSPRTCQTCHGSGNIQVTLDIEVLDGGSPITAYKPGQTYDVNFVVNHVGGPAPDGYGFQAVALIDSNDSDVDGWSAPASNVKIATASNTGRSYAEQNGVGNNGTFSVKWTAPTEGAGSVTFYSCGNGVNGNGGTGGDGADCATLQLTEDETNSISTIADARILTFPNPAIDQISVTVEGMKVIENTVLNVYNASGQLLHTESRITPMQNWQTTIDVAHYQAGIYFVQIQQTSGILTKRFVKK